MKLLFLHGLGQGPDIQFHHGGGKADGVPLPHPSPGEGPLRHQAEDDILQPPAATALEIPGAGHEVNIDAPGELAAAIRGFAENISTSMNE